MKVIVTGASGMVGEGVLLECLKDPQITQVLVVGRRSCGHTHPKLREILHANFFDLAPIDRELAGYDACFFCLGVSSVGMAPETYRHMTYDLTLEMARRLRAHNPELTFTYVTGMGTGTESRRAWARVKGETENELMRLFKNAYMFRPGGMWASKGQKNLRRGYLVIEALTFPLMQLILPNWICKLEEVGRAMIACARLRPASPHILEVADIKAMAAAK